VKVEVEVRLRVHRHDGDQPLEVMLNRVMEELITLGVEDPAIGADASTGEVEISLVVDEAELVTALSVASGTVRAALHAAESSTPSWPRFEDRELRATFTEDRAPAQA
jgi:hypothetical protein